MDGVNMLKNLDCKILGMLLELYVAKAKWQDDGGDERCQHYLMKTMERSTTTEQQQAFINPESESCQASP